MSRCLQITWEVGFCFNHQLEVQFRMIKQNLGRRRREGAAQGYIF